MTLRFPRWLAVVALLAATTAPAAAQSEDDAFLKPAQPDFTLVALPTGLRLPVYKSAFRVTHRFLRPLGAGDFGDLAGDAFGLDAGAQTGIEYRFGIIRNGQIGVARTGDKTIEFFAQYGLVRQSATMPVEVTAMAAVDGTGNFKKSRSPILGAILSRTFGDAAAVYVEPMWVNNTNPLPEQLVDNNDTFAVGLGARVQIVPSVYVTGEVTPRASGFKPGKHQVSFGLEKRVGGHMFQLNFSNGVGTLLSQVVRGGPAPTDWYFGFNITRKFF